MAGKVSGICVYSLQVLVSGFSTSWIYLFSMRYATGEARACGGFDDTLYWLSRTVGYVVLLGIIAFLLEIFGTSRGIKEEGKGPFQNWIITLVCMPLHFIAILLITVGYWNRGNANNYDIIGLAEKYDDDPDDDDNQHSAVGSILGSTRPIFWQLFPGGAILTKIGEATNAHIYFIDDNTGVDLQHGDNDRLNLAKYLANVVPMAFTILFALFPSAGLAITTTITLMPKILFSAFDQAKEIFDAFFPEALATTAVAIGWPNPHVENAIDQGINHGNKLVKRGKELVDSAKPHVEEGGNVARSLLTVPSPMLRKGVKRGKELVDSAKPHVQNAMEEGVKHGNELVDSAKPRVQNAMEEGVKHGNELVDSAKPRVQNAMEEGVKHGNELVDSAKPRVQNAMEEGVKYGNELVDSAKPRVQNAMEEGVKHGNDSNV